MSIILSKRAYRKAVSHLEALAEWLPDKSFVPLRNPTKTEIEKGEVIHPTVKWQKEPDTRLTLKEALRTVKAGGVIGIVIPQDYIVDGKRLLLLDVDSGKGDCPFLYDPLWEDVRPLLKQVGHNRTKSRGYTVPMLLDEDERFTDECIQQGIQDKTKAVLWKGLPGSDQLFIVPPSFLVAQYRAYGELDFTSEAYLELKEHIVCKETGLRYKEGAEANPQGFVQGEDGENEDPDEDEDVWIEKASTALGKRSASVPDNEARQSLWREKWQPQPITEDAWTHVRDTARGLVYWCQNEGDVVEMFANVCAQAGDWQDRKPKKKAELQAYIVSLFAKLPGLTRQEWRQSFIETPAALEKRAPTSPEEQVTLQAVWEEQQTHDARDAILDEKPHGRPQTRLTEQRRIADMIDGRVDVVDGRPLFRRKEGVWTFGQVGRDLMPLVYESDADFLRGLQGRTSAAYYETAAKLEQTARSIGWRGRDRADVLDQSFERASIARHDPLRWQIGERSPRDLPKPIHYHPAVCVLGKGVWDLETGGQIGDPPDLLLYGTPVADPPDWSLLDPATGRPVKKRLHRLWDQFFLRFPVDVMRREARHTLLGPAKVFDILIGQKGHGKTFLTGLIQQLFGQSQAQEMLLRDAYPPRGESKFRLIDTHLMTCRRVTLDECDKYGWKNRAKQQVPAVLEENVLFNCTQPTLSRESKGVDAQMHVRTANVVMAGNDYPLTNWDAEGLLERVGRISRLPGSVPRLNTFEAREYLDNRAFLSALHTWFFWAVREMLAEVARARKVDVSADVDTLAREAEGQEDARNALETWWSQKEDELSGKGAEEPEPEDDIDQWLVDNIDYKPKDKIGTDMQDIVKVVQRKFPHEKINAKVLAPRLKRFFSEYFKKPRRSNGKTYYHGLDVKGVASLIR